MGQDLSAQRAIAGRSGMHCFYCRVPTAATIEHVTPRAKGGDTWMANLVLACPLCNTRKSTREQEEFIASEDWKIAYPPMPETMRAMLKEFFGVDEVPAADNPEAAEKQVRTGSHHSRLAVGEGTAWALIRPGSKYQWTRVKLGPQDEERTIFAAYDFLTRHHTPKAPKKIPPGAFAKKRAGRR